MSEQPQQGTPAGRIEDKDEAASCIRRLRATLERAIALAGELYIQCESQTYHCTLPEAVDVLNGTHHRASSDWHIVNMPPGGFGEIGVSRGEGDWYSPDGPLTEFEALAVAEKYIREDKR